MKVLLVDVDSTIPNFALMKISTYYKGLNYDIELLKCNLPYYPSKKKKDIYINEDDYDLVFASAIFNDNYKYIHGNKIIFGGTSYDPKIKLPDYIEKCSCDYTIYNENKTTIDFITRGCIRNCYFCIVRSKEGYLHKVKDIDKTIRETIKRGHKSIMFLDNNILALKDHLNVFNKLIDSGLKVDFNQGLDLRLLNNDNQLLLSKLKYKDEYIFAFDDYNLKAQVDNKLHLLKRFGKWKVKLYIYVTPSMELSNVIKRVEYCKRNYLLPYVMRDISCWNSTYKNFYIDLASYCNQPSFFKKVSFETYLNKRMSNRIRIENSLLLYKSGMEV